jgi:hypothetical protein
VDRESTIAAVTVWAYVAIGAGGVALAAFVVLVLPIVWGRKDAPSNWDE